MLKSVSIPEELCQTMPQAGVSSWCERRENLRAQLQRAALAGISSEEIDGHFSAMPAHYWERVGPADLLWGIQSVHGFLKLVTTPNLPSTTPFVDWRQEPAGTGTRIMICTWDRHGLLAKAAAAFSAVRLNIVHADVFTRTDNVVLDTFTVVDSDRGGPGNRSRLEEMSFLLEGALSEPPRFASVWACSRHKFLASPGHFPPRIQFDNDSSPLSTIVRIEAPDRLGLLYDILQTLADSGLSVTQAIIETTHELAHDLIHVTKTHGQKVVDPEELGNLRQRLAAAISISDQPGL